MKSLTPARFSEGRWGYWVAPLLVLPFVACETSEKKETPAGAAAPAPLKEPAPAPDAARQQAMERQKEIALAELRQQVAVLVSHPSFDAALSKINEGLALDPQHPDFLKLHAEVTETLSRRCCGKWLRFDFSQPGAPKSLHGVLYSENLGLNYREHPFRGRILLACDKKVLSMRLRVPWAVPEGPNTTLKYTLGDASGSETVKTNAAPFVYEFPQPKRWFQKLSESENLTFTVKVPKRDGTDGEFTFELGHVKQIADEVAAACN